MELGLPRVLPYKLSRVDYLAPFRDLTKLQLDNNALTKIEGLDHLVHLRWLDLSFSGWRRWRTSRPW